MTTKETLYIKPISPFNFDLTARIFSDGDPQFCRYENGAFWRVIRTGTKLALVSIIGSGNKKSNEIQCILSSEQPLDDSDLKEARGIVEFMFGTGLDLKPFYERMRIDPVMKKLTRVLRGLRVPSTLTVFEALIDSIIEQQIALSVGMTMENRLIKLFGESLTLDNRTYFAYPTPEKLSTMTTRQSRTIGLSARKAEYIKGISRSVVGGHLDVEKYRTYEDTAQIIRELDIVRGIGLWTAELTVVRSMQKFDAMPADDLGLKRVISHYYCSGKKISAVEARKIASRWGEWRGLAAFYLIMAEEIEL